ncbi:TetR/AcrR family transcriptional regulator [Vibrio hibernica]|uniref:TetR/AcrR family transcriptional regulator n=1 Tax=Vibrio hibernica TaxID=2587465 RepID=UPI0039AF3B28
MHTVSERKQGRRSAEEAEKTKKALLFVAGELFSELGYKRVSLRLISEKAGVSHSLLRYHFGSKEKIWQHISDDLYQYFRDYFQHIVSILPEGLPANIQLYKLMNRVLACSLNDPRAVRFLADAVRQDKKMVNYFLEPSVQTNEVLENLVRQFKQSYPKSPITGRTLRWQTTMYSHSATTLRPLLQHMFEKKSDTEALFAHWQQFNQLLVLQLHIDEKDIERPKALTDLIVPAPTEYV